MFALKEVPYAATWLEMWCLQRSFFDAFLLTANYEFTSGAEEATEYRSSQYDLHALEILEQGCCQNMLRNRRAIG